MITQELHDQIAALVANKGMTLYDIEILKENEAMVLRISLYRKGGITLDDCEMISVLIAPLLDVELESLEAYHLEVSSPGIERVLKKPQHFLCSIGEQVAVTRLDKTILRGVLESFENNVLCVREIPKQSKKKQDKTQGKQEETLLHEIALSDCRKVKTIFEWEQYVRA